MEATLNKTTELLMEESELRYRRLFEAAQDGILILNAETGMIEDVNPYLIQMLGYSREEFIEKKLWEMGAFRDIEASQDAFEELQRLGFIRYDNLPLKTRYGHLIQVEFISNVYSIGDKKVIQCNIRDVTEHKRIVAALQENEKNFHDLVSQSPDGVFIIDSSGNILTINKAMCEELGYSKEEMLKMNIWNIIPAPFLSQYKESLSKILVGKSLEEAVEYAVKGKNGTTHYIEVLSAPRYSGKNAIGFQGVARDITMRNRRNDQIQRQLEHLAALSVIDQVIGSNFDLKQSLREILNHLTVELGVDAANFLILKNGLQSLEFIVAHGFRTNFIESSKVRMGESFAGQAAQEKIIIKIEDLHEQQEDLFVKTLIKNEGFRSYYCVPLINKGKVTGVLEVYNRTELNPDKEWLDFLNTLSGQAAIAIEITTLFESLQRSNSEITVAYDATIEGWSRALDLRDKETEGHTQRVTEMAVNLARAFDISDEELVHVRWGSLLHDIGKMGVPDEILLKPGPLTEEEWLVMRQHPVYAEEMLSSIRYLRYALDIPRSHHERWDGSGYPRGLKGSLIPLVARIFSVVDVWDALRSNRPYRDAWDKEKVREYIRSSSGTLFDPQVVDMFLSSQD